MYNVVQIFLKHHIVSIYKNILPKDSLGKSYESTLLQEFAILSE